MDVEATQLPGIEELTAWMRIGPAAVASAEKIAGDAQRVRESLSGVYTSVPVGVYWHKEGSAAGYAPDTGPGDWTPQDMGLVRSAVERCHDLVGVITPIEAASGDWIKVAYSPTLRRAGELLNFFPGKYPGGMPNNPGPVQSMLTSGLVGAGLGYGAGALAERVLPERWQRGRLRRTMAMLGGLGGAVPGVMWAAANKTIGRPLNDPSLLDAPANAMPKFASIVFPDVQLSEQYAQACATLCRYRDDRELLKEVVAGAGDSFADVDDVPALPSGPLAVNVDALGRTLWESGARPETAGMTMGAMAAAAQMPGGNGDPGFVTPMQMANLAAHMGAGYLSGAVVGSALGLLTGMPQATQDKLKRTGMYLGVVRSVVPMLFGQE